MTVSDGRVEPFQLRRPFALGAGGCSWLGPICLIRRCRRRATEVSNCTIAYARAFPAIGDCPESPGLHGRHGGGVFMAYERATDDREMTVDASEFVDADRLVKPALLRLRADPFEVDRPTATGKFGP